MSVDVRQLKDLEVKLRRDRSIHFWVLLALIAAWATGHWMGYWYGRTRELYESAKRYNKIPQEMTWSEFLNRDKYPGRAVCPKCGTPDADHWTFYNSHSAIVDMHTACWNNSSVMARIKLHIQFMEEAHWPEADQIPVIQATLDGK